MEIEVAIVGVGSMGEALLCGFYQCEEIRNRVGYFVRSPERRKRLQERYPDAQGLESLKDLQRVQVIIPACKPSHYPSLLKEIDQALEPPSLTERSPLILSVAAGLSSQELSEMTPHPILRTMPNLAVRGKMGVFIVAEEIKNLPQKEGEKLYRETIHLLEKISLVFATKESLFNALTALAGCSPAFVAIFIEALSDGAVSKGVPRRVAYEIALEMVRGSVQTLQNDYDHPAKLKDDVCSPSGVSIRGVNTLEECGFRNAVIKAVQASTGD